MVSSRDPIDVERSFDDAAAPGPDAGALPAELAWGSTPAVVTEPLVVDAGPPPAPPPPPAPAPAPTPAPTPAPAPAPAPTTLPACRHRALLKWGLHPTESDHLRCIGITATQITQTIGSAPASAGYHARDGYVSGQPYTAAVDLRSRGLTATQIRHLLSQLADHGFAGWYRQPGHDGWPSSEAPHIHAVYVGCHMKSQLQGQVRDFLVGRNGLSSHTLYRFFTWTRAQKALIRVVYNRYN